ncbi:MAG TPA: hypothetical protein VGM05_26115 [Planctomycetaceae bacterium]
MLRRGDRTIEEKYFNANYRHQNYQDLETALRVAVRAQLQLRVAGTLRVPSSVENSSPAELDQSLVFTHGYWVRSDMAEQDLVVVQDVALLNAVYKDCVSTGGSIIVPRDELSRVAAETALVPTLRVGTNALDALRRDPKNPARVQLGEYWPDFRPVKTLTLEELMRDHALQAMRRPIIEDEYRPVGRSPRLKALAVFARPFGLGRSVKLHQIASVVSLRSASLALLSHDPQLPRFSRQYPINSWVARNVTLRPIKKAKTRSPPLTPDLILVPTLRVGTPGPTLCVALLVANMLLRLLDTTQSVDTRVPTQSVGTRRSSDMAV